MKKDIKINELKKVNGGSASNAVETAKKLKKIWDLTHKNKNQK